MTGEGGRDEGAEVGPERARVRERLRLVLVDDHEVVRDGLCTVFALHDDIEVVGQAGSVAEGARVVAATHPDVAIVDIQLPDGTGTELCRALQTDAPGTKCLILTSMAHDEALFEAILAGAAGYVLKQVRSAELVACVRKVAAGESLIDPLSARRLRERVASNDESDPLLAVLSDQERRLLAWLAEGLTNREIAREMVLSEKTVKNYVSNVLMKLGMKRRSEAAAYQASADARRIAVHRPAPSPLEAVRF